MQRNGSVNLIVSFSESSTVFRCLEIFVGNETNLELHYSPHKSSFRHTGREYQLTFLTTLNEQLHKNLRRTICFCLN